MKSISEIANSPILDKTGQISEDSDKIVGKFETAIHT
jgi:hypothetical protein